MRCGRKISWDGACRHLILFAFLRVDKQVYQEASTLQYPTRTFGLDDPATFAQFLSFRYNHVAKPPIPINALMPKIAGKGKTSLPPRLSAPQSKKKRAPFGLPPKAQFTELPTTMSSDAPRSSLGATANASPGAGSLPTLPKEQTSCKGSVPTVSSYSTLPVPTLAVRSCSV